MHKFIDYISDLLFLHDCVIIPDFGGFICNYRSAYIDADSGVICPPGKDILFNRNLTHNDGLLVNWIADKENISCQTTDFILRRPENPFKPKTTGCIRGYRRIFHRPTFQYHFRTGKKQFLFGSIRYGSHCHGIGCRERKQ